LSELRAHRAQEGERLAPFARLTVRECEVLQDLVEGKNAERIANDSFVSVATVRSHIKSLLAKLGVNSQLAAVAAAQRAGWASPHIRPDTPD
jgi:DNA-binding NarL/FixJ family response regulator